MNVVAIAALLMPQAVPAAAPLAATGKWQVEYADNMCVLSHAYGSGDAQVTIGFRPWPMGAQTEIVMLQPGGKGPSMLSGKGQVMLGAGKPIDATYYAYRLDKRDMRLTTINVDQPALADLGAAPTITIALDGKPAVTVAPVNFKAALVALDKCDDDLLRGWGINPDEQLAIATPAKPLPYPAWWITNDDYPADALRRGSQGTSNILWTIGTDGKIVNCQVVGTSGDRVLDEAACSAIKRHGHYTPALDKDGKPVVSHSSRRVRWLMPS